MIGLDHSSLQCQIRGPYQMSSPYHMRRSEQSHHMIPLLSDLFMFFLLTFYIRLVNPIFLMYYILGLDVLLEHHAYCINFPSNTYIYHFLLYSLFSLLFCLWNMWFKVLHTSYTTQNLSHSGGTTSSLFFNRFCHIEDNVQLGWGES